MTEGDGSPPEILATIPNDLAVVLKRLGKLAQGRQALFCSCVARFGLPACNVWWSLPRWSRGKQAIASRQTAEMR